MKIKPTINQEVIVLFNGKLHEGTVKEVFDTPLAVSDGIPFVFNVIAKNVFPKADPISEGYRDGWIYSSYFHLEPHPYSNINWTNNKMFSRAFIFHSKKSYDKWVVDVRAHNRNYHLKQAELYK